MNRKVYTREILEALEIDTTPLTNEQIFEREAAIEKRWLEQFQEQEKILIERIEARQPRKIAMAKIGEGALMTLDAKGVVLPSIYIQQPANAAGNVVRDEIDNDAVTEIEAIASTYITMGRDFEIILQAIKDNPLLMSEWERFMLSLKMAQL